MRRRSNKADISEPFKKSLSGRTGSWCFRAEWKMMENLFKKQVSEEFLFYRKS